MDGRRRFPGFAFGTLFLLLSPHPTSGQTTGSITGRTLDVTGAPLPGVTIEATSPSLPGLRTTSTGPDGVYRMPAVPPGEYRIRASLAGFRASEKSAYVRLDAAATSDFTLEPATSEEVVVSGQAPLIDETSTTT